MRESRRRSIRAVLPQFETKLMLKDLKPYLHIDAGGFLTDVEEIYVFESSPNRVEHVRRICDILIRKDDAAFDSFCSILGKNGYSHWESALRDHSYQGDSHFLSKLSYFSCQ